MPTLSPRPSRQGVSRSLLDEPANGLDPEGMITSVDVDFTLTDGPPELADAFRTQAARCLRAIRAT